MTEDKLKKLSEENHSAARGRLHLFHRHAHWGKEESLKINAQQREARPALIDMGADIVYGTPSHTVQPIQLYQAR